MSPSAGFAAALEQQTIADGFAQLSQRPEWLEAALDPEQLRAALNRHVPEFASGALRLLGCAFDRLMLKNTRGHWHGRYYLTIEGLDAAQQEIGLRVTLTPPGISPPDAAAPAAPQPFGAENWRCELPELRLICEIEPPEQALETLPRLTDPQEARVLLERSIAEGSAARRDFRIRNCRPEVLNYKPGSRCTLLYHLEYDQAGAGRGWPATVVAKTYSEHKGERAYQGMSALWKTPLSASRTVHISEPLAYVPELKLLVQAPLAEEQTLEQLLRATLLDGDASAYTRLERFIRAAATGLAEIHLSGAQAEEIRTWDERVSDVPEQLERIAVVAPELAQAIEPLYEHLQALAAALPLDPLVPSHGSFDADQVLIAGEEISFIDFDGFCMAEPAVDVSHFRAALMDSGMKLIDEPTLRDPAACEAYLKRLDQLSAVFLTQYETLATVSHERLALWDALDYLRDALQVWTKPRHVSAEAVVRILEHHLRGMGLA